MWVFTRDGFFAASWDKDCKGDEVMIRARCREDLCRLSKRLKGFCDPAEISEDAHQDYRYRLRVQKFEWAEYLSQVSLVIDYTNIKETLASLDDPLRQEAYYEVWQALYRWQSKLHSPGQ